METEKDTGLIDQDSPEFKNFVKFGLISYVILAILGIIWEQVFKRIQNSKIKPFSKYFYLYERPCQIQNWFLITTGYEIVDVNKDTRNSVKPTS